MNFITNFSLNGLLSVIDGVGYLVGYVASLFVNIGGSLVNWTLDLNSQVLNNSTVSIGWTVSRDIANLGFVLAIIIIAFATILRIESYQMKKLLANLITAALLVNFSLVFAGIFIDFSGILTNFFINRATSNNPSEIGAGLADAFQVQKLLWPTDTEDAIKKLVQGLANDPNAHIPFTASVIFVAIFTTIVAISLLSLVAMLYLRYIWLLMLLILMPIAWLTWIWPDLTHIATDWWKRFIKWTLFAPAVTFFIYLALSIVSDQHKASIISVGFEAPPGITLKDFGGLLGRMLSVLGILYGGMYFAFDMGIAGAGAGFAVAKGVKNMALGAATVTGGFVGGRIGQKLLAAGAGAGKESFVQQAATKLSSGRLFGIPIPGLITAGSAMQKLVADNQAKVDEYQKTELSKLTDGQLVARANSPVAFRSDTETGAIAKELAKRRDKDGPLTNKISEDRLVDFLRVADKLGASKEILGVRPDLAAKIGKTIAEASKLTKEEDADKVPVELYENIDFVQNMKLGHLSIIGSKKSAEDKEKYIRTINSKLQELAAKKREELTGEEMQLASRLKEQANFIRKSFSWPGHGIDTEALKKFMAPKEIKKMNKEEGEI